MCEDLAAMRERLVVVRDEYERLMRGVAVMEDAVETMQWWMTAANGPESQSVAATSLGRISFEGCETTMERCVRMAEYGGGVLNCNDAADTLIAHGFNKGKRNNLVSAIQQQIGLRDDLWEYVEPRTYRYKLYQSASQTRADTATETSVDAGQSGVLNSFQ